MRAVDFSDLKGLTLSRVKRGETGDGEDQLTFIADDGSEFRMYHGQVCCEDVHIDDIAGDLVDLVGSPIVLAEMVQNDPEPDGFDSSCHESYTWTFYKLSTIEGSVTIRWFGSSNGYYSEEVSFFLVEPEPERVKRLYG